MRRRNKSVLVFLILLSMAFLSESGYAQTAPIVLKLDFPKPKIVKNVFTYNNVAYDSVRVESLDRYGAPGAPIIPFKTVRILIPQDKDLQNIEIITGKKTTLDGRYRIEYGKTQIPLISIFSIVETRPNEKIYASTTAFPGKLRSRLPLQNFRGYKIVVLNLYPVQYVPKAGSISYFEDMTVKVNLKPTLEISPLFRNLPKDKAKVKQMVDNLSEVNTYITKAERSHRGCICDPNDSYDYVIITSNTLKNSSGDPNFHDLVERKEEKGLDATIVTVEEIMADPDYACDGTYGDGCGSGNDFNDTQARIRNFIKDAYENWETEYVLLGGDGDGGDVGGESGDDIIPARNFWAFNYEGGSNDQIPADLYYAALDGNWNNDRDNKWGESGEEDFYAEVYAGRAPVDSEQEVSNFVMKTVAYETLSYDPYLKEAWMVGEYLGWSDYGGDYKDEIKDGSDAHGYTTVGFPDGYDVNTLYDDGWYTWPKSEIISIINNDTHLINHMGHANTLWVMKLCNAPVYQSGPYCGTSGDTDVDDLTNDKYCFVYSQGCYPGGFDNWNSVGMYTKSDSIAEHFVTSGHGAFAVIMNSRYGWYKLGSTDGASQHYDRQFWDAIFGEGITNIGKANQDSKEDNVGFMSDVYMKWCYYTLNLLGDPELEIWTDDLWKPKINQIQCHNSTEWVDCSEIFYKSNLTQVRANCTSPYGSITNATFKLENITGDKVFFDHDATSHEGDWWIYDNNDIVINDTGEFRLTVTCVDDESVSTTYYESWVIWGFRIKDNSGEPVGWFDNLGNLVLKGTLTSGGTCTAPSGSFIVTDSIGGTAAYIDNEGNMCIEGSCSEQSGSCNPTEDAFIIKDPCGTNLSYIDSDGDLCLTGELYENSDL